MKILIIFATLVALSYQSTTQLPHSTHEPSVHDQYIFHYDYHTQKMVIHKGRNCYIFTLTDQEKIDVHTAAGRTAVEIKFMQMVGTGTKAEVTKASLDHSISSACGTSVQHYYTVS